MREKYKKGWCVFYGFFIFVRRRGERFLFFIFLVGCFLFCPSWWCCWGYSSSFGSLPTSCAYENTDSSLGCSTLDHSWKNPWLFVCVLVAICLGCLPCLLYILRANCFNFFLMLQGKMVYIGEKIKRVLFFMGFLWVFYFLWYFWLI